MLQFLQVVIEWHEAVGKNSSIQLRLGSETLGTIFTKDILMKVIEIDSSHITNMQTFHSVFKSKLGFPEFYGNNMDAWIDCMTYIDDPDAKMTKIHILPGQTLKIILLNSDTLKSKHPEILLALSDCLKFVNERKNEDQSNTVISIAFS